MHNLFLKAFMACAIMAASSSFLFSTNAEAADKSCKWASKAIGMNYTTERRALWSAKKAWKTKVTKRHGSDYADYNIASRKKQRCWSRKHSKSATGLSWRCYVRAAACKRY